MDGRKEGWKDGEIKERMKEGTNERIDACTHKQREGAEE